ncbi:thioredoxin family protein [Chitinophaga sp. CF418]|uniref:thioredoxin family protein n=1 Tax=Chitinophaga sp. CF418 TaxID=1855287 RepID=UPI00091F8DC2|nr:thioredoxin family protein [Chitinophaga sp. CF418]SHN45534.1 Thioredoxin-like [Chitinophaga sp. CF418]
MNKIVIILLTIIPLFVRSQNNEEIKFSTAKSWEEVLAEAKATNKPIFVDLYTTWCTYCRQMKREVFADKKVAEYANKNFISVMVQMDSSKNDNEYIKNWYPDAAKFKRYVSTGYPCYLFFTADGKYSGKEEGFRKPEVFLTLLQKAIDPKGSYAAQIASFEQGTLNREQLLELAYWSNKNRDSVCFKIAKQYKKRYLDHLPLDSMFNLEADRFIATFYEIFTFRDKIIPYMYAHQKQTDSIFKRYPGYSKNITDYVIRNEFIVSKISQNGTYTNTEPDWKTIENSIAKKFDQKIGERLILDAKVDRYYHLKRLDKYAMLEFERMEKYGMDTTGFGLVRVNNLIYEVVFKNVTDTAILKTAVRVMGKVVKQDKFSDPERLDTYASILYKAGHKQKAIEMEKRALNLATEMNNNSIAKFFAEMIDKMSKDIPIWR